MNTISPEAARIAAITDAVTTETPAYGTVAKAIHWLHAALIITLLVLGWTMVDLPQGPDKTANYALHKSLGLCAMLLVLIRAFWRRTHTPPPLPSRLPAWQHRASHVVHGLIYALLIAAPLAGYLSASFTKYPMKFFGIVLPKTGWPDEGLNHLFNGLHKGLVLVLALTIALHVAAALGHALKRDGVMARMRLFGRKKV
jgi:cytochrome b561